MWVRALLADPSNRTNRQLQNLVDLPFDVTELASIEAATLQPQSLEVHRLFELRLVKARDKFQLVDCNLQHPRRPLAQRIQECLWVQQIAKTDVAAQHTVGLGSLEPTEQCKSLAIDCSNPCARVVWALPLLLPGTWHGVFEQGCGFTFNRWGEHLGSVKHADDVVNAFVDFAQDSYYCLDLHIDKLINGIVCIQFFVSDSHLCKRLFLVCVCPQSTNRSQTLLPLLLVKPQLLCTDT
jgi:hypothetical protein